MNFNDCKYTKKYLLFNSWFYSRIAYKRVLRTILELHAISRFEAIVPLSLRYRRGVWSAVIRKHTEYAQYSTSPKTSLTMYLHDIRCRMNQTRIPHTWEPCIPTAMTRQLPCRTSCKPTPSYTPASASSGSASDAPLELLQRTRSAPSTGPKHPPTTQNTPRVCAAEAGLRAPCVTQRRCLHVSPETRSSFGSWAAARR